MFFWFSRCSGEGQVFLVNQDFQTGFTPCSSEAPESEAKLTEDDEGTVKEDDADDGNKDEASEES